VKFHGSLEVVEFMWSVELRVKDSRGRFGCYDSSGERSRESYEGLDDQRRQVTRGRSRGGIDAGREASVDCEAEAMT
jgi:hypothetical protein